MPGFDVEQIAKRYQRIGQKYNPDMVVFLESGTGFMRFNELTLPLVSECNDQRRAKQGFNPLESSSSADRQKDLLEQRKCHEQVSDKFSEDHSVFERKQLLEGYLDKLFSSAGKTPVWFFYYEDLDEIYKYVVWDWQKKYPDKQFILNIPKAVMGKTMLADWHPNEFGHQEIAGAIYDTLVEKQAICITK
jgi:hypothetical protein